MAEKVVKEKLPKASHCVAPMIQATRQIVRENAQKVAERVQAKMLGAGIERPDPVVGIVSREVASSITRIRDELVELTSNFDKGFISGDEMTKMAEEALKVHVADAAKTADLIATQIENAVDVLSRNKTLAGIAGDARKLLQRPLDISHRAREEIMMMVQNEFDSLRLNLNAGMDGNSVAMAKHYFLDYIGGGKKLQLKLEETGQNIDEVMMKAIATGTGDDSAGKGVLNVIGTVMKNVDARFVKEMSEASPLFKALDVHLGKLSPNADIMAANFKTADEFAKFALQRMDINSIVKKNSPGDRKQAERAVNKLKAYYGWILDTAESAQRDIKGVLAPRSAMNERRFSFLDHNAELEYVKATQDFSNRGALGTKIDHWQRLMETGRLMSVVGNSASGYMDSISELAKIFREKLGYTGERGIKAQTWMDRILTPEKQRYATSAIRGTSGYTELDRAVNATTSFTSTVLTSFGSPIRNVTIDHTAVPAFIKRSLTERWLPLELLHSYADYFGTLFNFGGKYTARKAMLEEQKLFFVTTFSAMSDYSKNINRVTRFDDSSLGGKLEKISTGLRDQMNLYSGNNATYNAGRAVSLVDSGHIILNASRRVAKGEMPNNITMSYLEEIGLSLADLKALGRTEARALDGTDAMVNLNKIGDRDLYHRALNAHRLLAEKITAQHSHINIVGKTGDSPPAVDAMRRFALQFTNIEIAAWGNIRTAMNRITGGDPNAAGFHAMGLGGLMQWAKGDIMSLASLAGTMGGAGLMYLWTKDMLENRTIREVNAETIGDALSVAGFGGVAGRIIDSQLSGFSGFSIPVEGVAKSVKDVAVKAPLQAASGDMKKASHSAYRGTTRLLPWANLPYTRGLIDAFLRKELGIRITPQEKRLFKQRGQKRIIK